MNRIYLQTIAYNAEKTIERCLNSILNQTFKEGLYWYILDNGSTDDTLHILMNYAQKYSFIHLFHINNNCNPQSEEEHRLWDQFCKRIRLDIKENDYYCTIDSDDEYKFDFFEKMINFMKQNNLDIAVAGNDFIDVRNNRIINERKVSQNLILTTPNMYDIYFSSYHALMRPVWGKLYKGFTLKNYIRNENLAYGSDTWFVFHTLRQASRVGILNESLYKYYVNPKSVSYRWDDKRIQSDRILDDNARDFLLSKSGMVSERNNEFLFLVYFNAIQDTLNVLLNAKISITDKLNDLCNIFLCEHTQRLILWDGNSEKKEQLFYTVTDWLLTQRQCRLPSKINIVGSILVAMYPDLAQIVRQEILEYLVLKLPKIIIYLLNKDYNHILKTIQIWFKKHKQDDLFLTELEICIYHLADKPDCEIFMFYMQIEKKRPISYTSLNISKQIKELTSKYLVLQDLSISLISKFSCVVYWVLRSDFVQALEIFVSVLQGMEIADKDIESCILFSQNLSAIANNAEVYIYYKKIWISYLIDCSRTMEACQELDEFRRILPEDEDFIDLQKRLNLT